MFFVAVVLRARDALMLTNSLIFLVCHWHVIDSWWLVLDRKPRPVTHRPCLSIGGVLCSSFK